MINRIVSKGYYSEKDAAKAVREMLEALKVSPLCHQTDELDLVFTFL